jgi:hypothetical protein
LIELLELIGQVAKADDEEHHTLEILIVTFRRVIASIILLESGFPQEAHIVLRNALEWMLIAIDITYNKASLDEWKQTVIDDLKDINHDDWYFFTSKICKRIDKNEEKVYPELETKLSMHIRKEWQVISNMSVHAHSLSQIKNLFSSTGTFQFLGRKTTDKYEIDFNVYQGIIFDIVSLLFGIPKYRKLIGNTEILAVQREKFARNYVKIRDELQTSGKMFSEPPYSS